jgi:hypothetical protein
VTGTAIDTYATINETVTAPVKPTKWTSIEALVEQDAKLVSYPGTIAADGTITIPNVPDGPYWLVLTSPPPSNVPGFGGFKAFYALTSRTLDLGSLFSFRMDVESITQPTLVELNAALTEPWQAYEEDNQGNVLQELSDSLQIISCAADVNATAMAFNDGTPNSGPVNGATDINGWQLNANETFIGVGSPGAHLIRTDNKDDVMILHDVAVKVTAPMVPPAPDPWADYRYSSVKEAYSPTSAVMMDGATTMLNGSFVAVPQKTFSLDYKGSQFKMALADAPSLNLFSSFVSLSVAMEPGTPSPAYGGFATLLQVNANAIKTWTDPTCNPDMCDPMACGAGCSDAQTLIFPGDYTYTYSYGNPYTFGQEIASVSVGIRSDVTQLLPGDSTTERLQGSLYVQAPAAQVAGAPLAPIVGFARNVKVNGNAAPVEQVTAGVGTTPTISFEAPSLGTPEYYTARIIQLDDITDGSGGFRRNLTIASFSLTGTSIKIPDGLLQAGKHYYVQVIALANGVDIAAPFRAKAKYASATTYTGVITP